MEKIKVLDIFSGIGGFSLGLERTGHFETVAFCEKDASCREVLRKHWPDTVIYNDVEKLKHNEMIKSLNLSSIDMICGGFPCTDISIAGQKKGFKYDGERTRSGLWEEFKRLIKEIKPRYAIVENVANLRSLGLNQVIKDLWSIGYACEWHIISARSVGAPHLRERIWIIAYPDSDATWKQPRGRLGQGRKKEALVRGDGQNGGPADAASERLEGDVGHKQKVARPAELHRKRGLLFQLSNPNMPRLWQPFASEKEKQEWWTETTAGFRDWWKVESGICRVDDGLPEGMDRNHERARKERIKQLGNSVVPQIVEIIGRAIINFNNQLHGK